MSIIVLIFEGSENAAAHGAAQVIADFEDLQRLSGRTKASAVKKWLQDQGILYWLNADNQPVTTEQALNRSLERGRKTEPNWHIGK